MHSLLRPVPPLQEASVKNGIIVTKDFFSWWLHRSLNSVTELRKEWENFIIDCLTSYSREMCLKLIIHSISSASSGLVSSSRYFFICLDKGSVTSWFICDLIRFRKLCSLQFWKVLLLFLKVSKRPFLKIYGLSDSHCGKKMKHCELVFFVVFHTRSNTPFPVGGDR